MTNDNKPKIVKEVSAPPVVPVAMSQEAQDLVGAAVMQRNNIADANLNLIAQCAGLTRKILQLEEDNSKMLPEVPYPEDKKEKK